MCKHMATKNKGKAVATDGGGGRERDGSGRGRDTSVSRGRGKSSAGTGGSRTVIGRGGGIAGSAGQGAAGTRGRGAVGTRGRGAIYSWEEEPSVLVEEEPPSILVEEESPEVQDPLMKVVLPPNAEPLHPSTVEVGPNAKPSSLKAVVALEPMSVVLHPPAVYMNRQKDLCHRELVCLSPKGPAVVLPLNGQPLPHCLGQAFWLSILLGPEEEEEEEEKEEEEEEVI